MDDVFIEKIVPQRRVAFDYLKIAGLFAAYLLLNFFLLLIPFLRFLLPLGLIGGVYLLYIMIAQTRLEHEYIVTNGSLDIDRIYGQRRRKRVFSVQAKELQILAPISGGEYADYAKRGLKVLDFSARRNERQDWFFTANYKGTEYLVRWSPDERILKNLYRFNPSRIQYRPSAF